MDHHPMWDLCLFDWINETRMLSKMRMASKLFLLYTYKEFSLYSFQRLEGRNFNGQRPQKLVLLMPTDVPSRALLGIRFDVKEMDAFRLKASEDVASESSFLLEIAGDSFTREEPRALGLLLIPIESMTFDFRCPFAS